MMGTVHTSNSIASGLQHVQVAILLLLASTMMLVVTLVHGDLVLASQAQCANPSDVAVCSNGIIIVSCFDASATSPNAVVAINGSIVTPLVDHTQCQKAVHVVVNPSNDVAFVTCKGGGMGNAAVVSIASTGVAIVLTLSQCPGVSGTAVNTDGVVFVGCSNSSSHSFILAINGASVTTISTGAQCTNLNAMAVDGTSGLIVGCLGSGIFQIPLSGTTLTQIDNDQCPNPLALVVSSTHIVVACGTGVISIDKSGDAVTQIATSLQCPGAYSVAVSSVNGLVYASCGSGGRIISVDITAIVSPIVLQLTTAAQCTNPASIAASPTSADVYAACSTSQTIISVLECFSGEFYSPLALPVCQSCPVGRYQYYPRQTVCTNCSAGTFGTQPAQSSPGSCTLCPPGTENPIAGTSEPSVCVPCPAGSGSNSPGQAVCTVCAPGYYQPLTGQFQCLPCTAGKYQPTYNATSITQCLACPGTESSPPGSSSPVQCTAPICAPGLRTTNSSQPCQADCLVGSYCVNGVSQLCAAGSYNPWTKQSICTSCGLDRFGTQK